MALADYRLCDVCEVKTFYDVNLDQTFRDGEWKPERVGAWAVICEECAKTHEVVVRPKCEGAAQQGSAT
jgi:hypothetical protein